MFFETIKEKWFPVGIALRHLSANELMTILEELCPGAYCFPFHKRWQLVTFIKHFKDGMAITKPVKEKNPKTKESSKAKRTNRRPDTRVRVWSLRRAPLELLWLFGFLPVWDFPAGATRRR